jgi:hypothetical protein
MTFRLEQTLEGINLVVTGEWTDAAKESIVSGLADGLVLNYARGFRETDLRFLEGLPIRRLDLLDRSIKDLSSIYSLSGSLDSLEVQSDPNAIIDLGQLPNLKILSASWKQVRGSIRFANHVERLFLLSYSESDLGPLTSIPKLTSVVLKDWPRVKSLDGLKDLHHISELGIHLARYLTDIKALQQSPATLVTLQLPACRKLVNIEPLAACSALRFFDLSDGGEIPTIDPLKDLKQLERLYLYGSTKIIDGDLRSISQLPKLKDFRIQSRRHYAPTVSELHKLIALRE